MLPMVVKARRAEGRLPTHWLHVYHHIKKNSEITVPVQSSPHEDVTPGGCTIIPIYLYSHRTMNIYVAGLVNRCGYFVNKFSRPKVSRVKWCESQTLHSKFKVLCEYWTGLVNVLFPLMPSMCAAEGGPWPWVPSQSPHLSTWTRLVPICNEWVLRGVVLLYWMNLQTAMDAGAALFYKNLEWLPMFMFIQLPFC